MEKSVATVLSGQGIITDNAPAYQTLTRSQRALVRWLDTLSGKALSGDAAGRTLTKDKSCASQSVSPVSICQDFLYLMRVVILFLLDRLDTDEQIMEQVTSAHMPRPVNRYRRRERASSSSGPRKALTRLRWPIWALLGGKSAKLSPTQFLTREAGLSARGRAMCYGLIPYRVGACPRHFGPGQDDQGSSNLDLGLITPQGLCHAHITPD